MKGIEFTPEEKEAAIVQGLSSDHGITAVAAKMRLETYIQTRMTTMQSVADGNLPLDTASRTMNAAEYALRADAKPEERAAA